MKNIADIWKYQIYWKTKSLNLNLEATLSTLKGRLDTTITDKANIKFTGKLRSFN